MRLGVVSDTHGQVAFARDAVRMLESLDVHQVIHCGDIGSPDIIPLFAQWPTHFVFGNVDYDRVALTQAIKAAGQHCHGQMGSLELEGVKVAFLHGDDMPLLRETSSSGEWDLVCHGHTHTIRHERAGRTTILNPGAMYRANPHSLAIVDLPAIEVSIVRL